MNKTLFLIVAFVLPLLFLGCSNQVQLTGTVTYTDDGTPLEFGTVIFETDTFQARGDVENGKYTLASYKEDDGIPPGKYRVYISAAIRSEMLPGNDYPVETQLITPQYRSPATSGLEIEVDKSTKTFDFQVDREPGSKRN